MSRPASERVAASAGLGQGDRALDMWLGWLALIPPPVFALAAWVAPVGGLRAAAVAAVLAWGGALLAFWAGVRRGLSFSERRGAALEEMAAFLLLFGVAVVGMVLRWPLVLAGGFVAAGALDARAARRGEAPRYFRRLRPAQAAVGALSMAVAGARLLLP